MHVVWCQQMYKPKVPVKYGDQVWFRCGKCELMCTTDDVMSMRTSAKDALVCWTGDDIINVEYRRKTMMAKSIHRNCVVKK